MIRRYAAAAVAATTLVAAWPAQAAAKGVPESVRLCGPSACVRITDPAVRIALADSEGRPAAPAPTFAPYLRLTTRPLLFGLIGHLVPAQGALVLGAGSYRMGPHVLAIVRSRLAAVAPYRPRVGRVWVDGRTASDPGTYAAILRRRPVSPPPAIWHTRSMSIAISADGPWAAWESARYFPAGRLLHVPDGTWVRATPAQAVMIAADGRPARPAGGGSSAFPIAIVLGAGAVLAACAVRLRPRRRLRGSWGA
jgi:hypothetical protein